MAQRTNLKPITEVSELKGMGGCPVVAVKEDHHRYMWVEVFTLCGKPHKNKNINEWEIRVRQRGQMSRIFLGDHGIGGRNNFHAIFPYSTKALAEAKKLVDAQDFETYVQCIWHRLSDFLKKKAQLSDEQVQQGADALDAVLDEIMRMCEDEDEFSDSDLEELHRSMEELYDDLNLNECEE